MASLTIRQLDEALKKQLRLRAARNGFLNGFTSIYQARCRRPGP